MDFMKSRTEFFAEQADWAWCSGAPSPENFGGAEENAAGPE